MAPERLCCMLGKHKQQVGDCRQHQIMLQLCLRQLQHGVHMGAQQKPSMAVPFY